MLVRHRARAVVAWTSHPTSVSTSHAVTMASRRASSGIVIIDDLTKLELEMELELELNDP